jgi:CheY-like chemotaxis protein
MSRILLVEDDPDQLSIRRLMLEAAGHEVAAVCSAKAAAAAFDAGMDAVIMDLRLPRIEDGLELIRRFRGTSPGIRIIVLSGWVPELSSLPEAGLASVWAEKPTSSRKLLELLG